MEKKYTPCGGCGATSPMERCIGCFHPFESTSVPQPKIETVTWLNLADNFTEDWEIMHCRYAEDKRKLDTDLFELSDGWLVKKGGTGKLELHEVEYMADRNEMQTGSGWVNVVTRLPNIGETVLVEYRSRDLEYKKYTGPEDWWKRNVRRWLDEGGQ